MTPNLQDFLRRAVEDYHRRLRWDEDKSQHRDPFIHWYCQIAPSLGDQLELRVLLILVNARFDQGTVAERALANTQLALSAGILDRDDVRLEEIPAIKTRQRVAPDRWRVLFHRSLPGLRRVAHSISSERNWTAGGLLNTITGAKIPYFGPKTARLAVRWVSELVPEIRVDLRDSEVPIDSLVYRVTARLGLVDPQIDRYSGPGSPGHAAIQSAARNLFPSNPSYIDEPLWMMGRRARNGGFCFPTNPACDDGCIFSSFCPRCFPEEDPAQLGYSPVTGGRKAVSAHCKSAAPRPVLQNKGGSNPAVPGLLVIVSCVSKKIWDVDQDAPPKVAAGSAYVSPYFRKNRAYAKIFGQSWCILSAKFGLVLPDEKIENYNVTFKHRGAEVVDVDLLRQQANAKGLMRFPRVQVLGGAAYVDRVRMVLNDPAKCVEAPLAALKIGEAMHAVQTAIDAGRPLPSRCTDSKIDSA